jgi:hypothetical protein
LTIFGHAEKRARSREVRGTYSPKSTVPLPLMPKPRLERLIASHISFNRNRKSSRAQANETILLHTTGHSQLWWDSSWRSVTSRDNRKDGAKQSPSVDPRSTWPDAADFTRGPVGNLTGSHKVLSMPASYSSYLYSNYSSEERGCVAG